MTQLKDLKSLAHPEWPYTGSPHEWRGFAEKKTDLVKAKANHWQDVADMANAFNAVYQKQNFGPELT